MSNREITLCISACALHLILYIFRYVFEIKATGPSAAYIFKVNKSIYRVICDKHRAPFQLQGPKTNSSEIFCTGGFVDLIQNFSKVYYEGFSGVCAQKHAFFSHSAPDTYFVQKNQPSTGPLHVQISESTTLR